MNVIKQDAESDPSFFIRAHSAGKEVLCPTKRQILIGSGFRGCDHATAAMEIGQINRLADLTRLELLAGLSLSLD